MAKAQPPRSVQELDLLLSEIAGFHHRIDEQTAAIRFLDGSDELVRRAEEAGAALHRLEWELERFKSDR